MRLIDLLRSAVRDALDTDRKVGIVCSGGLDSSTVASLASQEGEFDLYTGFYDLEGFDERFYSRMVPGVHHEIQITPDDFVSEFDNMVEALRPPWQGPGCFGQWMVAKAMAADGVEVALSGEGADELYGGYVRVLQVAGWPLPERYPRTYRPPAGYPSTLEAALDWEMRHLQELLACDRQILEAHGIEGRAPFTDQLVVQHALELPATSRVNKTVLRKACLGVTPHAIRMRRDKMGFPIPLVQWAQDEPVRSFVRERLGGVPRRDQPYARGWWNELLEVSSSRAFVQ